MLIPIVESYVKNICVVFCKTKDSFGGLSNMAAGYPLKLDNVEIRTSEALYQALRFHHLPDLQREILAEKSPMSAKMKAKARIAESRPDFNDIKVDVMRWCLQLKLLQNPHFDELLLSTGAKVIVELSRKDAFWGAIPRADDPLILDGCNVLGKLLMELRDTKSPPKDPKLKDFKLLGFDLYKD